jgi:hypothetical protein
MVFLLIIVGYARSYLYFVRNLMRIPILVFNAVPTEWWRMDYVWIKTVWYLTMRVVVLRACRIMYLVTSVNVLSSSKTLIAKSISSIFAKCVHRDSTLTSNSTAYQYLPSAIPTIPIQGCVQVATQVINSLPRVTAVLSCSIVSYIHQICW